MRKLIIKVFLFIFMFFILSGVSDAAKPTVISELEIDSKLKEDESIVINEKIVFETGISEPVFELMLFDGDYSNFTNSIKIVQTVGDSSKELSNDETSSVYVEGIYKVGVGDRDSGKIYIQPFKPESDSTEYHFSVTYSLPSIIAKYDDMAYLKFPFINKNNALPISNWSIDINMERIDEGKAYYYGPKENTVVEPIYFENGKLHLDSNSIVKGGEIYNKEGVSLEIYANSSAFKKGTRFEAGLAKSFMNESDKILSDRKSSIGITAYWEKIAWIVAIVLSLLMLLTIFYVGKLKRDSNGKMNIFKYSPLLFQSMLDSIPSSKGLNATLYDFIRRGAAKVNFEDGYLYDFQHQKNFKTEENLVYEYLVKISEDGSLYFEEMEKSANSKIGIENFKRLNSLLKKIRREEKFGNLWGRNPYIMLISAIIFVIDAVFTFKATAGAMTIFALIYSFIVVSITAYFTFSAGVKEAYLRETGQKLRDDIKSGTDKLNTEQRKVWLMVLRLEPNQIAEKTNASTSASDNNNEFYMWLNTKDSGKIWMPSK